NIAALIQLDAAVHEIVEANLLCSGRPDLPGEEAADRVAAHDAVEQGDHLSRLPDVLALDRGKDQILSLDLCERRSDGGRRKVRHQASMGERVIVPGYAVSTCSKNRTSHLELRHSECDPSSWVTHGVDVHPVHLEVASSGHSVCRRTRQSPCRRTRTSPLTDR